MPWYRTEHVVPPTGKEVIVFKDGTQQKAKYEKFELMDSAGQVSKDAPKWWTYQEGLDNPPAAEDKGITHMANVQEELLQPKIVKGKPAPKGIDFLAEGSLDNR